MIIRNALKLHPRVQPLVDGTIAANDVEFEWLAPPSGGFRGVSSEIFDLYEYSFSGYLLSISAMGQQARDWVALPIFLSRCFDVLDRFVSTVEVSGWADLNGRRVIAPDVGMTAAIWMRVILRELYHVDEHAVTWINSRQAEERHTTELGFEYIPEGLMLEQMARGDDPLALVASGAVDAGLVMGPAGVALPVGVRPLADALTLRRMFNDFARTKGATPVNHVVLARRSLLEENPGLARYLYDLIESSKHIAYERARAHLATLLYFPDAVVAEQRDLYGDDPFPSGVDANQKMVELLLEQLVRENQLHNPLDMASIFTSELLAT